MAGIRCRNESYPVTANASLCSKCGQAHYLYCPLGNAAHGQDIDVYKRQLYGILPDMSENTELWIRGKDDVGNEISFNLISYRNPELRCV